MLQYVTTDTPLSPLASQKRLLAIRTFTRRLASAPYGEHWLRVLRRILPSPPIQVLVEDFDGTLKIILRLDEHMQSTIFWGGLYCRDLANFLGRFLRPGMTVIDVGANIGEFTLLAAKRVGPRGLVVAYEPISDIVEHLNANIAENQFRNVVTKSLALSDREGSAEFFRSPERIGDGTVNDGLGSLYVGNRNRVTAGTVTVATLDKQVVELGLSRVDLIKMDIEGAELAALRGAESVLQEFRPTLIIEVQEETARAAGYHTSDLFRFLEGHGYRFETVEVDGSTRALDPLNTKRFQNVVCHPTKGGDLE